MCGPSALCFIDFLGVCLGFTARRCRFWRSQCKCDTPSPPPPSFTQYPSPPRRSLVLDGQTSPLRPRLVVSRSTCPSLSHYPHANSFVIGTAVINTHTTTHSNSCLHDTDDTVCCSTSGVMGFLRLFEFLRCFKEKEAGSEVCVCVCVAFAHRRSGWQPLLILVGPGLLILVFHFSNTWKNTDSLPHVILCLFLPPLFARDRLLVLRNVYLCTSVRVSNNVGLAFAGHVLMVLSLSISVPEFH